MKPDQSQHPGSAAPRREQHEGRATARKTFVAPHLERHDDLVEATGDRTFEFGQS